jgi:hypothetical protein
MKRPHFLILLAIATFSGIFFSACDKNDKNNSEDKAKVQLMLTDAPAVYDAVYVDIREVLLHSEVDGWVSVPLENPGIYNLLEFSNGLDVLLGDVYISPGMLSQMRLVLGSENSVVVDGVTYPLTTPSGSTSGLKLNMNSQLEAGLFYKFWLDFDAARSIHVTGNGNYMLKPVIRMYSEASGGAITGNVFPAEAAPIVTVFNATDTLAAFPAANGHFLISGIPEGIYTVTFSSRITPLPVLEVVVLNVAVVKGETTVMANVTLLPL